MNYDAKQRIVQELVPGKQVSLAHIIANPDKSILAALKLDMGNEMDSTSIGVLTVTPPQTAIILADIAVKSAGVRIAHLDCYESGSLMVAGTVSQVKSSVGAVLTYVENRLGYEICDITQ